MENNPMLGRIISDIVFCPQKLSSTGARQEAILPKDLETRNLILKNNEQINKKLELFLQSHRVERIETTSEDKLNLVADFFKNKKSHRYILIIHGYLSSKEQMRKFVPCFYEMGFNIVVPDSRAHGESQGKWTTFGIAESKDVICWINRIVKEDKLSEIVIMGVSCGASTAMMASSLNLPENVKKIIADCGFSSLEQEFSFLSETRLGIKSDRLFKSIRANMLKQCGFDIASSSPITSLENTKLPILFIHGSKDAFVPCSMQSELIDHYKGPYKESLLVTEAPHAQSFNTDPLTYMSKIESFLKD